MQVGLSRKSNEGMANKFSHSILLKMEELCQVRLMIKIIVNGVVSTNVTVSAEDLKTAVANYASESK